MTTLNNLLGDESSFEIKEENARILASSVKNSAREQYFDKEGRFELYKLAILTPFIYAGLC